MAENTTAPVQEAPARSKGIDPQLHERTALQIYLHKIGGARRGFDPKIVAAESFREAKAFCEIAQEVRMFGDEALEQRLPQDDGLDWASAPNLPKDHEFNKRSKRFGNKELLAKSLAFEHDDPTGYAKALKFTGPSSN